MSDGCHDYERIFEMNIENKIQKMKSERDFHLEKAKKHNEAAKELEGKITDLENTSIVGIVRESGLTPAELAELISLLKDTPAKAVNERTKDDENE